MLDNLVHWLGLDMDLPLLPLLDLLLGYLDGDGLVYRPGGRLAHLLGNRLLVMVDLVGIRVVDNLWRRDDHLLLLLLLLFLLAFGVVELRRLVSRVVAIVDEIRVDWSSELGVGLVPGGLDLIKLRLPFAVGFS